MSLKSGRRGTVRAAALHHLLIVRCFRPQLCLPATEAGRSTAGAAAVKHEERFSNNLPISTLPVSADCKYILPRVNAFNI